VGAPAASDTPQTVPPPIPGADIELRLEAASATAERGFDAPDPLTHTQIIEVTLDPTESPVTIDFTTATGTRLHVHAPQRHDCGRDGERIMCLVRFPILEAQRSGRWTVTASKTRWPSHRRSSSRTMRSHQETMIALCHRARRKPTQNARSADVVKAPCASIGAPILLAGPVRRVHD
jgi:hypothetical protein